MASFRFLYRESDGVIGPAEWVRASALPIGAAVVMTALAYALAPGPRDLGSQPFFSLGLVATHAYFIIYGFALILLAIMQYFVSAKRFRDLGRPPGLAGALPFSLLVAGAAAWLQPRSEGVLPAWSVWPFVALAFAVAIWNVVELGFVKGKSA